MALGRSFNMSAKSALLSYCVWNLSKAQSGMSVSTAQSRSVRRIIAYSLLRRELLRRKFKRLQQRRLSRAASTPHQHRHREDLQQDLQQDLHEDLHEDIEDEEDGSAGTVDKQQQTEESDTLSEAGDDMEMLRLLLTEKEPDSIAYFGLFLAAKLREMEPLHRNLAMGEILQVVNSFSVSASNENVYLGASPMPVENDSQNESEIAGQDSGHPDVSHDSLEEALARAFPDEEVDTTHDASCDDLEVNSPGDLQEARQDDLQGDSLNVLPDAVPDVVINVAPQDSLQDSLHESSQDDSQCASLGDYLDSFHNATQGARDL